MHLRSCPVDHSFLSVSLSLCSCCHNWRILSSYRTGQRICSDFHIRTAAGCRRFADLGSCTLSALFSQLPASPNSLLLLLPSPSSCCCCVGFVYQHTNLVGALTPSKHARIVAGEKRTCSGGGRGAGTGGGSEAVTGRSHGWIPCPCFMFYAHKMHFNCCI